ncbi:hypothetical protein [Paraburkholderia caribensis]|nr:hypothetical protein [Paraburkholderia caribensis]
MSKTLSTFLKVLFDDLAKHFESALADFESDRSLFERENGTGAAASIR